MENQIVAYMRTLIGKEIEESPSAFSVWLKGKLRDVGEGMVEVEYVIREEMTNPVKGLHGGVAAGILDDILGAAVFTLNLENYFTSVNLNVDFLSSAKIGDTVIAHARVTRKGRNIIHVEGTIKQLDGKLVAKAASNLVVTPGKTA